MKKITLFFIALSTLLSAQNIQMQNTFNYTRSKEYDKAKVAADLAIEHEQTRGSAKMWMYRGNVYKAIYSDTSKKVNAIDNDAEEKALESFVKCLELDKGRDIYKDDVKGSLVDAANRTNRKASRYVYDKNYTKALRCYDILETCLPFDFDGGIKRNNITKEKLLYSKFELYVLSGNNEKATEYAQKLMAIQYKDVRIYTEMTKLSLQNKDTAKALEYIEKGKLIFEDNMDLITTEIDIYIKRNKTDILKDRLKSAIELTPDNEVMHYVLAVLYKGTNQPEEAEKEYLKAIELKPDYEAANYNLGVLNYAQGKEWMEKANKLPPKDPKSKEYEDKANAYFKKAAGYLETSYNVTKDAKTKKVLWTLYVRLGDTEKAEKFK